MNNFDVRVTPRLVQQIALVERFAGRWDRLSSSPAIASQTLEQSALMEGVRAALLLDSTTPVALSLKLGQGLLEPPLGQHRLFDGCYQAHLRPTVINNITNVVSLFELLSTGEEQLSLGYSASGKLPVALREVATHFFAPTHRLLSSEPRYLASHITESSEAGDEIVFPTVTPFLIDQRLQELLSWANDELRMGLFHPLFIIATFHLALLQIHPFPVANHRLALVLTWRLLIENGYPFVKYRHFAPFLLSRHRQYVSSLRQAERTFRGSWATLPVWLECFLEALNDSSEQLLEHTRGDESRLLLTTTQQKIIDVVKNHGTATRERVASDTGINLSTVKYNLTVLAAKGHLKREGGGRTTSYRVV